MLVFIVATGVQLRRKFSLRKIEAEASRQREQELMAHHSSEEIPFGARALEQGLEVEGIWISRPGTPLERSETTEPRMSLGNVPRQEMSEYSSDMRDQSPVIRAQDQNNSQVNPETMQRRPEIDTAKYPPRKDRIMNGRSRDSTCGSPCASIKNDRPMNNRHNRRLLREMSLPTVSSIKEASTEDTDTIVSRKKDTSPDKHEQGAGTFSLQLKSAIWNQG